MPYFIGTSIVINDNAAYVHESFTGTGSTTGIGSTFTQIVPSDGAISSDYGFSVAVGSQKIVVGAQNDDDNGNISGAAYIYDLDGSNEIKITASDGAANDRFGYSVSVGSGRIVIGARGDDIGRGAAYIYDLDGNQLSKITASDGASNDFFGWSVSVGSGRIVVGAYNAAGGAAYIFDLNGTQLSKITASDGAVNDRFGWSVSVGSGRIVVGAYVGDSAYVFDLDGIQLVKIDNPEVVLQFGYSCSIADGKIVIADLTTDNGSAYIFDYDEDSNSYWESIIDTYKY
jgi:hypothetical protein